MRNNSNNNAGSDDEDIDLQAVKVSTENLVLFPIMFLSN